MEDPARSSGRTFLSRRHEWSHLRTPCERSVTEKHSLCEFWLKINNREPIKQALYSAEIRNQPSHIACRAIMYLDTSTQLDGRSAIKVDRRPIAM